VSELEQLLTSHDSMEESDFYPWIDEYANSDEIKKAFEKLDSMKRNI
jgi:hemerythrin superfamily protein